jgi:hypothetical protein
VGACYLAVTAVGYPATDRAVDCARSHDTETVFVGTFAGPFAAAAAPPPRGSRAVHAAFKVCDTATRRFVGGDWRGGRLSVQVVVPAPQTWTGGGRWYRCDVFEVPNMEGVSYRGQAVDAATSRTGSLRAALTRRLPLSFTCLTATEEIYQLSDPVPCTKPHQYEYVGAWTAPDLTYEDLAGQSERLYRRCRAVIGAFLGLPKAERALPRTGVSYREPSANAWALGDRGVRCFIWTERPLTRSLRGAGLAALAR